MIAAFATNEQGWEIEALFVSQGSYDEALDWSDIRPWWLVVTKANHVVAAVQFFCAKPIARLELLVVDQSLRHRDKVRAVKTLLDFALELLHRSETRKVMFATANPRFAALVTKRYDGVIVGQGCSSMEVNI